MNAEEYVAKELGDKIRTIKHAFPDKERRAGIEEFAVEAEKLAEENMKLKEATKHLCPSCDGSGSYAVPDGRGGADQMQCQWCDEHPAPILELMNQVTEFQTLKQHLADAGITHPEYLKEFVEEIGGLLSSAKKLNWNGEAWQILNEVMNRLTEKLNLTKRDT